MIRSPVFTGKIVKNVCWRTICNASNLLREKFVTRAIWREQLSREQLSREQLTPSRSPRGQNPELAQIIFGRKYCANGKVRYMTVSEPLKMQPIYSKTTYSGDSIGVGA